MKHPSVLLMVAIALAACTDFHPVKAGTYTWNRQAYGQAYLLCPTGWGTYYTNYWPNNARWSQVQKTGYDCEGHPNSVISEPSNWNPAATKYPNGPDVDVILGPPARTVLDVSVALNSLTVQPGGALEVWTAAIAANNFDFQTDGVVTTLGGGHVNVMPGGSITKSGGDGLYGLGEVAVAATNATVIVKSGSLQLGWSTVLGGSSRFEVAEGTVLDLQPSNPNSRGYLRGSLTGVGPGTVRLGNGLMYIGGPVGTPAGGATFDFPDGLFEWTNGGIQSFSSADPLVNVGTMTIHAVENARVTNGPAFYVCFFHNQGLVKVPGSGAITVSRSTFFNEKGGVVDLEGDNGFAGDTWKGSVVNTGTFRKSAGAGTATIDSLFAMPGGTVEVQSGHLAFLNTGTYSNATFVIAAGSTVSLASANAGSATYLYGLLTGSGAGHLVLDQGVVTTFTGSGTFDFPQGFFQWSGGTIESGAGYFTNAGAIAIGGPVVLKHGVNVGQIRQTATGSLNLGGVLYNQPGALYEIEGDNGIQGGRIENSGTLRKTVGTGTSTIERPIANWGTIRSDSGKLRFAMGLEQKAGTLELRGDSIDIVGNLWVSGGVVTGTGGTPGNIVNASGTVSPGAGLGTMTLGGTFTQWTGATLACEVGGRNAGEFDQLAVTGAGYLGGTLTVTLLNGFKPAPGDEIPLVTYSARGGIFAELNLPPGTAIEYRNNGVYLVAKDSAPVRLGLPTRSGGDIAFGFPTTLGQGYTVWSNDDLNTAAWVVHTHVAGTGGTVQFVAPVTAAPQQFFRVTQP
jgi:hypothetical protein